MPDLHIDFTDGIDDAGRDGSQAQPWKTLEYVATRSGWAAGNRIRIKRGGLRLGQFNVPSSGTVNNPITINAYGDGVAPILQSLSVNNNNSALTVTDRQYLVIEDLDLRGYGTETSSGVGAGLYAASGSNGAGLVARRLRISGTKGSGLDFGFYSLSASRGMRDILVEDCVFEDCGFHGSNIVGRVESALFQRNTYRRNGKITDGYGFSAVAAKTTVGTSGWTNSSGSVYSRATAQGNFSGTIAAILQVSIGNRNAAGGAGLLNLVDAGATTTPALGQYGFTGGTLYINVGAAPSSISGFACQYMFGRATNIVARNNTVSDQIRLSIEGVGMVADDMSVVHFLGNDIRNCAGGGLQVHRGIGSVLHGNLVVGCGQQAIRLLCADACEVSGNTLVNCGVGLLKSGSADYSANNLVHNNVIQGMTTGISGIAGDTVSHNAYWQCNANLAGGQASAGNDVTTDPKLTSGYGMGSGSPLLKAGKHIGNRRDLHGRQRPNPPSIGARDVARWRLL